MKIEVIGVPICMKYIILKPKTSPQPLSELTERGEKLLTPVQTRLIASPNSFHLLQKPNHMQEALTSNQLDD